MKILKICPLCEKNLIKENEKYCDKCKKRFDIKERAVKRKPNGTFENKKEWNRNYEENVYYQSKDWKVVREKVVSEQLGLCMICFIQGKRTKMNILHHIIPVKEDKRFIYDSNNLICLCHEHHAKVHQIYNQGEKEKKEMQKQLRILLNKIKKDFKF